MRLTFYERVGFEGRRPSPFSWRIRYALAHKGIDFDVQPVRFADVETIRRLSGQHLTPVIDDNGKVTHETWDIANYLEDRFPDRPSLAAQPYFCGSSPAYADYIVFSVFQMARLGCPKEVVAKGSALADWRTRMILLYDGLGDRFPAYPR